MEIMTLILLLTVAVLLSAVIDQLTPKVTLPLVQIAMGVVIAVFARDAISVSLDPEIFLVVFIAPLLYIEAKHADKMSLWKYLRPILGLAIVLVIITSFAIGAAVSTIDPVISIFAALALGAALGPTDAIAVTSVAKTVDIPKRDMEILRGELLLNDASGIVMFQVAITAAASGSINVASAGTAFIVEFFGGLIVGLLFGICGKMILAKAREIRIESTVFHVLFEICMPFVVYIVSDTLHVSGIIAVVTAGLVNPIQTAAVSPAVSRMNIVSTSVWEVFSFGLNGIVFVLLGTQIPVAMSYVWEDPTFNNASLLALIAIVTIILLGVRFIWMLLSYRLEFRNTEAMREKSNLIKSALRMTLSGAKGTITLSILFTCPFVFSDGTIFAERDLIIFVGCGVILFTLLLATFVLPLIAPKKIITKSEEEERQSYLLCLQEVLRSVISQLSAQETDLNRVAIRQVVKSYQARLNKAKEELNEDDVIGTSLRIDVCKWQQEAVEMLIEQGNVDEEAAYNVLERYEHVERILTNENLASAILHHKHILKLRPLYLHAKSFITSNLSGKRVDLANAESDVRIEATKYAIEKLRESMLENDDVVTEHAAKIMLELETSLMARSSSLPTVTSQIRVEGDIEGVKALAYEIELDKIAELVREEKLSKAGAKRMRQNVGLMQLELADAI